MDDRFFDAPSGSQRLSTSTHEPPRAGRGLRRVLRALAWLGAAIALAAIGTVALLHSLDRPWLKREILALARTSLGLDLDYRAARVDLFSKFEIDGLVVRSPARLRRFAPDLLRVGHIDARWSLRPLLHGHSPVVGQVTVSDVALDVVVDEHGTTSFDALPLHAAPTRRPLPPSAWASKWLAGTPPIARLDVERVALAVVRTKRGEASERTELGGLSVSLVARAAIPGTNGWGAQARFGSSGSPLELHLARAAARGRPAAAARARFWALVDADARELTAALDLTMVEQTLVPSIPADHWLRAAAGLRFDPAAGRTEVTLDRLEAGDETLSVQGSIDIPDVGAPVVRRARGDVDIARLLHWLPAGLVPVSAERARARWQIDGLAAGPAAAQSSAGAVSADVDLSNVAIETATGSLVISSGALSVHARSIGGGWGAMAASGSVTVAGLRFASDAGHLAAGGVALDFDGRREADETIAGRVELRFARAESRGKLEASARGGRIDLGVEKLRPDARAPPATRGDITLSADVASLDGRFSASQATLDDLTLRAHASLGGGPPYSGEIAARASRLRVIGPGGAPVADAPARIECRIHDLQPRFDRPGKSRGGFEASVALGAVHASLNATKTAGAVDFALRAMAPTLALVRPLVCSDRAGEAGWDQMAIRVRSTGRIDHLDAGEPALREATEIDVEHPSFGGAAARSLALALESDGTALRHRARIDVHASGLAIGGSAPSDDRLTLSARIDRDRRSLAFDLTADGHAAAKLSGSLSFDPAARALEYDVSGHLARLGPLTPLAAKVGALAGFELSRSEIDLAARGALFGVIRAVAPSGAVELEASPALTAAAEGAVDLRITHLHWARAGDAVIAPAIAWHADTHAAGLRRTIDSRLEAGAVHIDLGDRDVELGGIHEETSASVIGDLTDPQVELGQHLSIGTVTQDILPEYPLGDVRFALSAERSAEGVVHLSEVKLTNGLGGTALSVSGNVDLGERRRTIALDASVAQDLARLSTSPDRFDGRGTVTVEANVTSSNLAVYNVRAAVEGHDVTVTLPRSKLAIDTANGVVPVTVVLEMDGHGIALERTAHRSPYSILRFADQHPLLARSGFLSIGRLDTPVLSIAPLVGNLAIDQNVVSLRQFEMGVRGGTVTGLASLAWEGPKSTLELHVRASGVRSSHGEPFDGNIAVVVSAADRSIDGRAEILRIGERHLLDLLDMEDPLHLDPSMNRVRGALRFGYPENLRLVFDHGFASAHLQLGGLARLVRIGEIRGIPMGPIIDKIIASMLEERGGEEKEPL